MKNDDKGIEDAKVLKDVDDAKKAKEAKKAKAAVDVKKAKVAVEAKKAKDAKDFQDFNDFKDAKAAKKIKKAENVENAVSEDKNFIGEAVMTAGRKKEILKERAILLAEEVEETQSSDRYIDIVEFSLARETYGIQSEYVRQVCLLKDLTQVPCIPPYVLGIISLHEQIVSVIDIRTFFGLESPGITNLNRIIVLHSEKDNMEFGILADEIHGMKSVAENTIQSSLATLSDNRAKYFYGLSDEQTIILDAQKILTDKELVLE